MLRALSVLGVLLFMAASAFALEIHDAATQGDLEKVKALLAADPDLIRAQNETGATPLHSAAYNGQKEVVEYLLSIGADINARTSQESCPLHGAAFYGHTEIVKLLIAKGANLNPANRYGYVPLLSAAAAGNLEIVKALIEAGADKQASIIQGNLNALQLAASAGNMQVIEYLLTQGFDLNYVNNEGLGFLHLAAMCDSLTIVQWALDQGLDPNLTDNGGGTPLHMAVRSLYQQEMTPARAAIIRLLAARGANINAKNQSGETPLGIAVTTNKSEAVRLLIECGADVNNINESGVTPLMSAVQAGNADIVQILLEKGARTDTRENNYGKTPLHTAVISGNREIVKTLANQVADFNIKDNSGKTALYYAGKYGYQGIANLLISKGAIDAGIPRNFGTPQALMDTPEEGQAHLWYLGHCGWGIRTKNHFMIFDYFPFGAAPDEASLANGHIDPAQLKDLKVEVFVTHAHTDHYDSVIYQWQTEINNLKYIFGFRPEELPEGQRQGFNGQPYEYIGPHENCTIDGMQIKTIASNDGGVGFLVEADGLKIFHAGDHAGWENGDSIPFTSEIDYLAELAGKVDMAFVNTTGCRFSRDTLALQNSIFYTISKLSPQVVIPTHGLGREFAYRQMAEKIRNQGFKVNVFCADVRGDDFEFAARRQDSSAL